jgi:hypothetical protein
VTLGVAGCLLTENVAGERVGRYGAEARRVGERPVPGRAWLAQARTDVGGPVARGVRGRGRRFAAGGFTTLRARGLIPYFFFLLLFFWEFLAYIYTHFNTRRRKERGRGSNKKKWHKKKVAAPRFDRGTSGYHRKYGPCALYQLRHAACNISSSLSGYDRPSMPQSLSYPDKRSCRVVPPDPTLFLFFQKAI